MGRADFDGVDGHRSLVGDGALSVAAATGAQPAWRPDGEAERHKIHVFVRGTVRRNTKAFPRERVPVRIDAEALATPMPISVAEIKTPGFPFTRESAATGSRKAEGLL